MNNIEQLKQLIKKFDIISFDIFGTLLENPLKNDKSTYKYISEIISDINFFDQRIESQKKERISKLIRNKNFEEIKLSDIYQRMMKKYHHVQEIEKELLFSILYPNQLVIELFNYAKKLNKTIIITSDTFYDKNFICKLLSKNSINGYKRLFLSCDYGKTKASGNLFKLVIDELHTDANKIIHFGDNKISDIERANTNGIYAVYIDTNNFNNLFLKYAPLKLPKAGNSDNYWYQLGYCIGGYLALSFVQNVIKISEEKNINKILFVARDGYILKKIFDLINSNKELVGIYVYASRHLKTLYGDCFDKNKAQYESYISDLKIKNTDKLCIVDTATANYSAESLLKKYISNSNIIGIYLTSTKKDINHINLTTIDKPYTKFNWDFIELLIASIEFPIVEIKDSMPVYETTNLIEQNRKIIYEEILKGEIDFVKDYLELFKKFKICLSIDSAIISIIEFWNNLTTIDKSFFHQIKHAIDPENKIYFDILSSKEEKVKMFIKKDISIIRKKLLRQ